MSFLNSTEGLSTAVLFLVFNRPDTTKQVFEAIRMAKPSRLYIAADGPREDKEGEAKRVREVRSIATNVDWNCEVKTLFHDKNLGCKYAVSGAITWFFEQEEQGIILEDDCLPNHSFFWFCEELLERYKDDQRIGQISGYNKLTKNDEDSDGYNFLTGGSIWGWASWRRVADGFNDFFNKSTDDIYVSIYNFTDDLHESEHIKDSLDLVNSGNLSTWDYHWGAKLKANSQLSIVPLKNLIKNIGFCTDATHTINKTFNDPPVFELNIERIIHPEFIFPNKELSKLQAKGHYNKLNNIIRKVRRLI